MKRRSSKSQLAKPTLAPPKHIRNPNKDQFVYDPKKASAKIKFSKVDD